MSQHNRVLRREEENNFWEHIRCMQAGLPYFNSLYSLSNISYYEQRFLDRGYQVDDLCCVLLDDGIPIFGFLGSLCSHDDERMIAAFEIPAIAIEAVGLSRSQKKAIASMIDDIFTPISPVVLRTRDELQLGTMSYLSDYLLSQQGRCKTNLSFERIIDLTEDVDRLRSRIRRRYHSLINKGLREFRIKLHDSKSISWETMLSFRELHIKEAGRETRSIATWEKQYASVLQGEAFCITGTFANELVSAGLFTLSSRHCYYGVSASRRDMFNRPLFHCIMWTAILHAKNNGAIAFCTGDDYPLDTIGYDPSAKERHIAAFKAGFGGNLKPVVELEVYVK